MSFMDGIFSSVARRGRHALVAGLLLTQSVALAQDDEAAEPRVVEPEATPNAAYKSDRTYPVLEKIFNDKRITANTALWAAQAKCKEQQDICVTAAQVFKAGQCPGGKAKCTGTPRAPKAEAECDVQARTCELAAEKINLKQLDTDHADEMTAEDGLRQCYEPGHGPAVLSKLGVSTCAKAPKFTKHAVLHKTVSRPKHVPILKHKAVHKKR